MMTLRSNLIYIVNRRESSKVNVGSTCKAAIYSVEHQFPKVSIVVRLESNDSQLLAAMRIPQHSLCATDAIKMRKVNVCIDNILQ